MFVRSSLDPRGAGASGKEMALRTEANVKGRGARGRARPMSGALAAFDDPWWTHPLTPRPRCRLVRHSGAYSVAFVAACTKQAAPAWSLTAAILRCGRVSAGTADGLVFEFAGFGTTTTLMAARPVTDTAHRPALTAARPVRVAAH